MAFSPGQSEPTGAPLVSWSIPTPPEGQRWHRDDWDASTLPAGFRPLMANEFPEKGDEYRPHDRSYWNERARDLDVPVRRNDRDAYGRGMALPHRTRRTVESARFATVRPYSADSETCPHNGTIKHEVHGTYCALCGLELINDRVRGWIPPPKTRE